jgi:nitrate reductase NapE component
MVFDGLSDDNEIAQNLNDHQSKRRRTHLLTFLFLKFILYLFRSSLLRLSK